MKRRIWLWVLVSVLSVVLIKFTVMRGSGIAPQISTDCLQGSASVQSGCLIYHSVGNNGHSCANCHGEPGYCRFDSHPWDQHGTCDTDPQHVTAPIGKTISLLGASKSTLKALASVDDWNAFMALNPADAMTVFTEAQSIAPQCIIADPFVTQKCETAALFLESGVTSDLAFNNLAAYLAWADPIPCPTESPTAKESAPTTLLPIVHCIATYGFSGTIYGGAKLLPGFLSINITSEYNPVNPQISTAQSGNDVNYSASGLLAGDYTVSPGTFPYLHFPPSCTVTLTYEYIVARNPCPPARANFSIGRFGILTDALALGEEVSSLAQEEGPSLVERRHLNGIMKTANLQLAEGEVQGATMSLEEFVRLANRLVHQKALSDDVGRKLIQQAKAIIEHLTDGKSED